MENSFAAPPPSLAKPRSEDSTYDPSALALSGRLGRIRYFVYATIAYRFGPAPSPNPGRMISAAWIVGAVLFALFTCLLLLPGGTSGP